MAVEIEGHEDPRPQQILRDPIGYFSAARERVRHEVELEIERERALG